MKQSSRYAGILVFLFFATMTAIATFADSTIDYMRYVSAGLSILFLLLAVRQMRVWSIYEEEEHIVLKRILGESVTLAPLDLLSIEVSQSTSLKTGKKTTYLEIHTTKGKFGFDSSDYWNFKDVTNTLFRGSPALKKEYLRRS